MFVFCMHLRQDQLFVQPVGMAAIKRIGRIAAPAVIDQLPDNTGAQRIFMDAIGKLHQVNIIFNQDAFIAVIIGDKDILLVIAARKNVIKCTFILNSPGTACRAKALATGGAIHCLYQRRMPYVIL